MGVTQSPRASFSKVSNFMTAHPRFIDAGVGASFAAASYFLNRDALAYSGVMTGIKIYSGAITGGVAVSQLMLATDRFQNPLVRNGRLVTREILSRVAMASGVSLLTVCLFPLVAQTLIMVNDRSAILKAENAFVQSCPQLGSATSVVTPTGQNISIAFKSIENRDITVISGTANKPVYAPMMHHSENIISVSGKRLDENQGFPLDFTRFRSFTYEDRPVFPFSCAPLPTPVR